MPANTAHKPTTEQEGTWNGTWRDGTAAEENSGKPVIDAELFVEGIWLGDSVDVVHGVTVVRGLVADTVAYWELGRVEEEGSTVAVEPGHDLTASQISLSISHAQSKNTMFRNTNLNKA